VVAFLQGCVLLRTLPYAQPYSPANPIKVLYWDEKKISVASTTPTAEPQYQFEDNYLHKNAYK